MPIGVGSLPGRLFQDATVCPVDAKNLGTRLSIQYLHHKMIECRTISDVFQALGT